MATESGYGNQKKIGKAQYKTIQNVGSDKFGVNTAQMYLYDITPAAIALTAVDVDANNPQILYLEITSHGAKEDDIVRILDNDLAGWELDVIEVIDANIIAVHNITHLNKVATLPAIGDEVKICRWITAKADSEGALTTSSGPVQFVRDGSTATVVQDNAVPANNRPLPSGMYVLIDGVAHPVGIDTVVPANTVMIPVQISSISGPISVTADELNIHTSSEAVNYDSMRIGDGSGIFLKIEADGSITSNNPDVVAALAAIDFATEVTQELNRVELVALNAKDFATQATLVETRDRLPVALGMQVAAASFPVVIPQLQVDAMSDLDSLVTGNITTENLNDFGAATANSSVEIDVGSGKTVAMIQITGTWTGALSFQGTVDGSVWLTLPSGVTRTSGSIVNSISSGLTGLYAYKIAGLKKFRISALVAQTGTAVVSINQTSAVGWTSMDLPLPTGSNVIGTVSAVMTSNAELGIVTEVAPATDTASSGLNGRLQRIAQRLTSLIALLPTSLGQKAMAASLAVTIASDQSALSVTQSAMVGSYQEDLTVTDGAVETFTAPANAKWCKIMADETNSGNARVKIGAAATTTSGMQFQPGRSEDYMAVGDVSYTMETGGTGKLYIQFGV